MPGADSLRLKDSAASANGKLEQSTQAPAASRIAALKPASALVTLMRHSVASGAPCSRVVRLGYRIHRIDRDRQRQDGIGGDSQARVLAQRDAGVCLE